MGCAMGMIKYLLFIFNFVFALCGLGILIVGIVVHLQLSHVADTVSENVVFPSITLIVIGAIIFVIAFFGCCGAIQESHCMTITYASCLLTILILQVAVAVYAFVVLKDTDTRDVSIKDSYRKIFSDYWDNPTDREVVDVIQSSFKCCGVVSPSDYRYADGTSFNGTIPWSCCNNRQGEHCVDNRAVFPNGCAEEVKKFLKYAGNVLGGVALGIAGVELVGIVFALCLANSIRNAERRGYRV